MPLGLTGIFKATIQELFVRAIVLPIKFPIGPTPISAPNKNIPKPIITNTAPIKNLNKTSVSNGEIVKFNIKTKKVIGNTENDTSLNFFKRTLIINTPF